MTWRTIANQSRPKYRLPVEAFCTKDANKSANHSIFQPASTKRLKLWRYLSTRCETAPPKLEVSFRVMHVS